MDLLETFLDRRIQPLQARDHTMWHYTGPEDSTRSHPEEVNEDTVAEWIRGIAGPCDNPMGAKRVLPFSGENSSTNKVSSALLNIFAFEPSACSFLVD